MGGVTAEVGCEVLLLCLGGVITTGCTSSGWGTARTVDRSLEMSVPRRMARAEVMVGVGPSLDPSEVRGKGAKRVG